MTLEKLPGIVRGIQDELVSLLLKTDEVDYLPDEYLARIYDNMIQLEMLGIYPEDIGFSPSEAENLDALARAGYDYKQSKKGQS